MPKSKNTNEILNTIENFNTNGKKTVAIFTDAYYPVVDGVVAVVDNYAKRLTKYFNVVVCAPYRKRDLEQREYLVIGMGSIYFSKVGYDYTVPELDAEFKKTINQLKIDIIHLHSPFNAGFFAVKLAKKRGVPVVGTFHSLYKQDFYKQTKSKVLTTALLRTIMRVYNKCTEVWTMNDFAGNELKNYGYKGKIHFVRNSSNFALNPNLKDCVVQVNEKYHLSEQENILLFVGRLVSQKNILFLVDVAKILKEKGFPFKMVFVGTGPDEYSLKEKIEELDLKDEILLTGIVKNKYEMQGLFTRADLFVFPSVYDTDGVVKIEAGLCGTPTLALYNTGAGCEIRDGKNGYLCEENETKYAQKIVEVLKNKRKNAKVGKNAKKELYISWDKIVEGVQERYLQLIAENILKSE